MLQHSCIAVILCCCTESSCRVLFCPFPVLLRCVGFSNYCGFDLLVLPPSVAVLRHTELILGCPFHSHPVSPIILVLRPVQSHSVFPVPPSLFPRCLHYCVGSRCFPPPSLVYLGVPSLHLCVVLVVLRYFVAFLSLTLGAVLGSLSPC